MRMKQLGKSLGMPLRSVDEIAGSSEGVERTVPRDEDENAIQVHPDSLALASQRPLLLAHIQ